MISKLDGVKGLNVFSKKAGGDLNISVSNGTICIGEIDSPYNKTRLAWQDFGWSNTSDNWIDHGWANSGGWGNGRWVDNGWSNSSNGGHWTDQGWNNDGSGCYVTTACVEHVGLSDNCDELETLRKFRDMLVEEDETFRNEVLEYYRKAPIIVQKINESETKDEELDYLYINLVQKCVDLLKNEQYEEAKEHYINVFHELLVKYNC